ncbi:unnamed protein product [Rotaria sordida]|uniref:Alpha/beta-hydrolase n=1 Tax=Rotaria sordida TaxID=392033 RepID=A0A814NXV0_9BILA|nr:unnamed protein product [Rotaria sordida]CAF3728857.1 unnamed protein product [Rotaria sordida]
MSYLYYLKRFVHITPKYDQSLIIRNVAYFSDFSIQTSSEQQETNKKQIPIIVHIHGGGWVRDSRANKWRGDPTMMDDLCRALVYIRDHINEHCPNADPKQIFLSGHSSGAYLISLLILDKSHLHRHEFSFINNTWCYSYE